MPFIEYQVTLEFENYIAKPYWPEAHDCIEIEKKSGMNRARSEDRREAALVTWLKKEGLDKAGYMRLKKLAARRWYRLDNDDDASEIIIPRHHIAGCLVQGCKSAPSGAKFKVDDFRARVRISDFRTGKFKADEKFIRFIKNDLTNQRRLENDEVIKDFVATGTLRFDPLQTKPASIEALLSYSLAYAGVGSARKMGYGRGIVRSFAEIKAAKKDKDKDRQPVGV